VYHGGWPQLQGLFQDFAAKDFPGGVQLLPPLDYNRGGKKGATIRMPFLLLLVLTLTCLQRAWPAPPGWLGWPGSVVLTWGVMALFGLTAWLAARWWYLQLQHDASARSLVLARYAAFRRWHFYLLLAVYFLVVCFGGWGWCVAQGFVRGEIAAPGTDLIQLSPLFAGLMLVWAGYYPLEGALARSGCSPSADVFPGRWSYVVMQTRHNFILVAPPLALMFLQQLMLALLPSLLQNQLALPLIGLGLVGVMYVTVPLLLRLLLGLKRLPDGPLRERLLATARRLSFRFSDILVWNTRRSIVNAMVTGPLPLLRYVVVTDRLIEELTPEEVEAVFGHEVGHIKHHHLLFYFGFLLASLVVVAGLWEVLSEALSHSEFQVMLDQHLPDLSAWLDTYQMLSMLPLLALLGIYIFVVFGFLSRRCERQADIYGCHTVSVPVFVEALEKVGRLNGISRDRPGWLLSWQHSTIARRVDFLERMQADPNLETRFQRRVGLVKWGMLLSLAALLAVVVAALGPANAWAVLGSMSN
jgi:STE24 endopeptidase